MGARDDIARLMKEAAASMKHDATGAVAKLASAYALARDTAATAPTAAGSRAAVAQAIAASSSAPNRSRYAGSTPWCTRWCDGVLSTHSSGPMRSMSRV